MNGAKTARNAVAVILAAGSGERYGNALPKQFLYLSGRSLLHYSLAEFSQVKHIGEIVLVVPRDFRERAERICARGAFAKIGRIVNGGRTRQESSWLGVRGIREDDRPVLIHDAARPLVSARLILACLAAMAEHEAVCVAVPACDTIFQVDKNGIVDAIPERRSLVHAQTPQGFRVGLIREAHERARREKFFGASDDCSLILRYALADVHTVPGEARNRKITTAADMEFAAHILRSRTKN